MVRGEIRQQWECSRHAYPVTYTPALVTGASTPLLINSSQGPAHVWAVTAFSQKKKKRKQHDLQKKEEQEEGQGEKKGGNNCSSDRGVIVIDGGGDLL